jgi:DHA1 family multidrug resistance protein-like MFS transporter
VVPLLMLLLVLEIGISFFSPLLPQVQEEFRVSAGKVALVLAIYNGIRLLFNMPLSRYVARAALPSVLAIGGGILGLGGLVVAFAPTFAFVLVGRAIMGLGSATFILAVHFWLARVATPETKVRLFSYHQIVGIAGSALGPALGGIVAGWFSCRHAQALAVIAGLATLIAGRRLPYPAARATDSLSPLPAGGARVSYREVLSAGMAMLGFIFFYGAVNSTILPLFAARTLHLGPAAIGAILMLGTVQRFGAALLGGRLVTWFGTRRVVVLGLAALALSALSFLAVTEPLGLIVAVSLISWANLGGSFVIAMLTDRIPEAHWGTALGLNRTMGDLGGLVAPILSGFIIDRYGFSAAFVVATCVLLLAAAMAAVLTVAPPSKTESLVDESAPAVR